MRPRTCTDSSGHSSGMTGCPAAGTRAKPSWTSASPSSSGSRRGSDPPPGSDAGPDPPLLHSVLAAPSHVPDSRPPRLRNLEDPGCSVEEVAYARLLPARPALGNYPVATPALL